MALNYSNLLQPNKKVQSSYASLTQKSPAQNALSSYISPPLIKPPVGNVAGTPSGANQNMSLNPIKKVENKNTGVTTHYDTAVNKPAEKKPTTQNTAAVTPTQPITGNAQTPSGATVDSKTGGLVTPPPEQTRYASLLDTLTKTATDTSAIDKANQGLLKLRQDYNTAVGNIENTPIPLNFQQGRAQVLGRQFASQESAAQQALSNELTARGQNIGALGSAAGLASPRNADIFVDPATGKVIGDQANIGSALAGMASIRAGANTAGTFTTDYQTGLANLRAADSIGQQILSTLETNPTLNSQPLSAITNLKQLLSGQVSSGPQQLLSQQINQYIQTLGLDSNTVMNIASQQQGTLGQLLDSLRSMAGAQIESKNPQNIINNPTGTQPTQSSTPQIINTAVGPVDNSWFQ